MGIFKLLKDGYEKDKKAWGKKIAIFIKLPLTLFIFFFISLILFLFNAFLFRGTLLLTIFSGFLLILFFFLLISSVRIKFELKQIVRFEKQFSKIDFESSNETLKYFKKFVNYSIYALEILALNIFGSAIGIILVTIIIYPLTPVVLQSLWTSIPLGLLILIFLNYFSILFLNQKIVFSKLHNAMKSFLIILIKKYSVESEDRGIEPLKNDYELMVLFIEYMNFCFRKMDKKEIANEGQVILKLSKIEKSESSEKFSILINTYEKSLKTISTFDISLEKQKIRPATLVRWIIGIISSLSLIISLIMMISTFNLQ